MTDRAKPLSVNACETWNISPEQLRSLLGQIEDKLHHSEVYRRTLAALQTQSGEALNPPLEDMSMLIKAMGREAIRISLQHFLAQERKKIHRSQSEAAIAPVTTPPSNPTPPAIETTKKVASFRPRKVSKAQLAQQKAKEEKEQAWKAIGEQLQHARYARSLSLEQLHALTRIPLHELKALEAGDLDRLPEEVYLQGFVRRLSIVLGLDSQQLLSTLPTPDTRHSVIPSWYRPPTGNKRSMYLQPAHLYVGYTALMAGAVGGLTLLYGEAPSGAAQEQLQPGPQHSAPDRDREAYAAESLSSAEIPPPEALEPNSL
ncbi:helix-turn-helix domain-containing protein [Roseofilum casamattae]|uniref:Helix-turn-helix domain-containing protein n=1 Tax=Roseofilum casamattae BLCC-M143 TaxID=3022442 RepID=A0ABT7C1M7_9CYAN|nr:helix-turn-helix domain-containing protein [Roseofilum casamattae]MDJ1185210.1 helix-turn-helix domain-containing protein [Roseofilum casamattae BLCC-M143]